MNYVLLAIVGGWISRGFDTYLLSRQLNHLHSTLPSQVSKSNVHHPSVIRYKQFQAQIWKGLAEQAIWSGVIWARIYERVWKWGRGGTTGGDLDRAGLRNELIPLILLTILVPSILFLLLLPIKTFTFFNTYSIPFTCSRVGKFILGNSVAGLGDIMIDGGGGVVVWWMIGGWWIVGRVIGWMGIGGDAGAGAGGEWALLKVVCMGSLILPLLSSLTLPINSIRKIAFKELGTLEDFFLGVEAGGMTTRIDGSRIGSEVLARESRKRPSHHEEIGIKDDSKKGMADPDHDHDRHTAIFRGIKDLCERVGFDIDRVRVVDRARARALDGGGSDAERLDMGLGGGGVHAHALSLGFPWAKYVLISNVLLDAAKPTSGTAFDFDSDTTKMISDSHSAASPSIPAETEPPSPIPGPSSNPSQLRLSPNELASLIAHELGHWYHFHWIPNLIFSKGTGSYQGLGISLGLFAWMMSRKEGEAGRGLFRNFGFGKEEGDCSLILGWMLFRLTFGWARALWELLRCGLSQWEEYQADRFAASIGYGPCLSTALVKIDQATKSISSPMTASTPTTASKPSGSKRQQQDDWLYHSCHASHPTAEDRVEAIGRVKVIVGVKIVEE